MTAPDPAAKARVALGVAFTGAGVAHIVKHEWFEQLVPASLARWRKPISAVTAVIQLVGGISLFVPRLRALARWTNLAMLVPTLPAAVAQTRHPDQMRALGVNPKIVVARIPAQMLVAAATWWATRSTATPIDPRAAAMTSRHMTQGSRAETRQTISGPISNDSATAAVDTTLGPAAPLGPVGEHQEG